MWYKCYIVWPKAWTACVGLCAVWSPWQTPIYQSRGDHSPSLLEGKLDRKESAVCGLCENWPQRNVLPKAARKKNLGWEPEENEQRLSVTARTVRKQSRLAEETKHERRPTIADGTSGRLSLKHTAANICTTADGRYPENRGLHHEEWAQEEMAAFHRFEENLRHYHCSICKEVWPLSGFPTQIFTCSRCKRDRKPCRLYSAENDVDPGSVPAELQCLSEVEELLIARAFKIQSLSPDYIVVSGPNQLSRAWYNSLHGMQRKVRLWQKLLFRSFDMFGF